MKATDMFFDSWGGLWVSCEADHPKAEAFGPTGVARRANPESEGGLFRCFGESAMACADRWGLVISPEDPTTGWYLLADKYS